MELHHTPRQGPALLKHVIASLCLLLVVLCGGQLRAETAAERAAAKQAFIDGDNAFRNERYEDALAAFSHGYDLSKKPRFLLNIAHTQRKLGRLRDALATYQQFLASSPSEKDRVLAEQMVSEVEPLVAKEDADRALREREAEAIAVPSPQVPDAPAADVQASPAPPAPVYKRWYFWAGVGAVVAAGIVTAVVLSGGDDATRSGSWGQVRL